MGLLQRLRQHWARKNMNEGDDGESDEEESSNFGLTPSMEPKDFEHKELDFFADTSRSQLLPGFAAMINDTALSSDFKFALISTVAVLWSKERLLANNNPYKIGAISKMTDPRHIKMIKADIMIWRTIAKAHKVDWRRVDILSLFSQISSVHDDILSRTIGPKRERLILTEMKSTLTSISEKSVSEFTQTPQKKNGLGFK